jgi:hypothetical protein
MKGRFFLTVPLLTLVACGTINMGTLAYAEFDPVKREYPQKREGTLKQSKCGLMAVPAQLNMGAWLDDISRANPGLVGFRDFELYSDSCTNLEGIPVKGDKK